MGLARQRQRHHYRDLDNPAVSAFALDTTQIVRNISSGGPRASSSKILVIQGLISVPGQTVMGLARQRRRRHRPSFLFLGRPISSSSSGRRDACSQWRNHTLEQAVARNAEKKRVRGELVVDMAFIPAVLGAICFLKG